MASSSIIPRFYRVFFTLIDPALTMFGVIMHTSPSAMLPNYSASPVMPPATETRLMLDSLVGFYLLLAFLQVVLLRLRPNDVGVWKVLQASTILLDVAVVLGFLRALSNTGRLDTSSWRSEEWSNIGITSTVGILRAAFVVGIGMDGKRKEV